MFVEESKSIIQVVKCIELLQLEFRVQDCKWLCYSVPGEQSFLKYPGPLISLAAEGAYAFLLISKQKRADVLCLTSLSKAKSGHAHSFLIWSYNIFSIVYKENSYLQNDNWDKFYC